MSTRTDRSKFFRELFHAAKPHQWRKLTVQDVDAARSWHRRQLALSKAIAGVAWTMWALPAVWYATHHEPPALLAIAFGSFAWLVLWAVLFGVCVGSGARLEPLKESAIQCKRALGLLYNPNVRAYRDAVLANGRELLAGDLECMQAIAEDLDTERTCRILHGLEPVNT